VGIGTTAPTEALEVAGNVRVAGNVVATGSIMGAGTASSFTATPTGAGVGQGSLFVNPGSAGADQTLFGVAVGGAQRFRVDTEGDVFGAGGAFSGATTATNSAILRATQMGSSGTTAEFINPPPAAARGETTTSSGVVAGVLGISNSSEGIGVTGLVNGSGSIGVYAENANSGAFLNWAILALTSSSEGTAIQGEALASSGNAWGVNGLTHSSLGIAVRADTTASSGNPVGVWSEIANTGGDMYVGSFQGDKRFRVDSTGKGFFDGGTQNSGADFAESVEVLGERAAYEPGDVMLIDPSGRRRFMMSQKPYSTGVAGIYSTKPGVLATTHQAGDPRLAEEIPMAIVGIVPCKVTAENGPIAPGDLLVTSSAAGHAMRGARRGRMLGAIVGKALEAFDPRDARGRRSRRSTGVIQVLVTLQ